MPLDSPLCNRLFTPLSQEVTQQVEDWIPSQRPALNLIQRSLLDTEKPEMPPIEVLYSFVGPFPTSKEDGNLMGSQDP